MTRALLATVTHRQMLAWVEPWPITWKGRRQFSKRWGVSWMPARTAAALFKSYWHPSVSVSTVSRKRATMLDPGRIHHIAHVARDVGRPVIVVNADGVVLDGNHTLAALSRSSRPVMVFQEQRK